MKIHVVKPGETVYSIGHIYGVTSAKIISDNELKMPNQLVIGQTLVILQENIKYMVQMGDSIYLIARKYGVSVKDLMNANPQISDSEMIYPGQIIIIPYKSEKLGTIEVNGFARTSINIRALEKALPNLTYLSIFSYDVRMDGSLSDIDDEMLIGVAKAAKVAPIMVVSNIKEGGSFDSDIAHSILTDKKAQETLINNIEQVLKTKGYYGVNIDFEYIYPKDKEAYNDFLRNITSRLNSQGYIVTTDLAPKTSATQKGLLYEAHDYKAHGEIVDNVILMTYEWGYLYGPPMAVAPIDQVKKVLDYAVAEIPSKKIFMGIPNYGYDWTLPYKKGTAAKTVSNIGAIEVARKFGAIIRYDQISQAPYFHYYDANGKQHEVWFEDARSIDAKLQTVNVYNLGGISYWTVEKNFPQNWLVLNSLFNIKKVM